MVVDDTREFTIPWKAPVGYPKASVVSVNYPTTQQDTGASVVVSFTLKNIGDGAGVIYAELKDKDTDGVVGNRATSQSVAVGSTFTAQWTLTMPAKAWNLKLEAGH